ncbi:hypothetical protein BD309DRAFT_953154, partial [Dichomitus squalens]
MVTRRRASKFLWHGERAHREFGATLATISYIYVSMSQDSKPQSRRLRLNFHVISRTMSHFPSRASLRKACLHTSQHCAVRCGLLDFQPLLTPAHAFYFAVR